MKTIIIVLTGLFFLPNLTLSAQQFHTKVGASFPSFNMPDLSGKYVSNETLKGKPTLLVFFGTRCPPCLRELDALNTKIPKSWYQEFNIYLVGSTDDKVSLELFNYRKGYNFNYIPDPNQELFFQIADYTIPRTFLLDGNGKIISQTEGFNKSPFESLLNRMKRLANS